MIKKLFTGLIVFSYLAMYGQSDDNLSRQKKCVSDFIAKVSAGTVTEYNDICNCFNVSCVNDLSNEQLKQVIRVAVEDSHNVMPYATSRSIFEPEGSDTIIAFFNHIDQQNPLIDPINDLYLRDRISKYNQNRPLQKKIIEDSITMLEHYITAIENKNTLQLFLHKGVLDDLVANPKNLQQLKSMKQELSKKLTTFSKDKRASVKTPWVQDALNTIKNYEPYLDDPRLADQEIGSPDDHFKPLRTDIITRENIKALSYWEFCVLANAAIRARALTPDMFIGGPDWRQSQIHKLYARIHESRPVISYIIQIYVCIKFVFNNGNLI